MIKSLVALLLLSLAQSGTVVVRRAAGPACDSPDDVAGLILQLETDSGVSTDAFGVYDWDDQSTSDNDAVQAVDADKPDVVADHFASGYDAILGDDSTDYLTFQSAIVETGDTSIFVVIQPEGNAFEYIIGTTNNRQYQATNAEKIRMRWGESGYQNLTANGAYLEDDQILLDIHRDGSGNFTCFVNGVDLTDGTPNDTDNLVYASIVGVDGNENGHYYGAIIMYDNKVSGSDAACVRTYLNDKATLY